MNFYNKIKSKYMSEILVIVLAYAAFCLLLYVFQRNLMYFPDKTKPDIVQGAELVNVTGNDGQKIQSWYFPPSDNKPVIVYFHGNAGNFGHRYYSVSPYLDSGYGVLLAEYRGYGGNAGSPSEEGIYRDARAQIEWLEKEKGIIDKDIVIFGESIGTGVAVQIASERNVRALILESPFSSMLDIASGRYFFVPVKFLLKDRYMSIDKIGNVEAPLLVLHGVDDEVVPLKSAQKLFSNANDPKIMVEFPNGTHNNLLQLGAEKEVLDFLDNILINKGI